ncbi:fatty acid desaturase [Xylophilus sp. GW821-FHT01B05]
MPAALHPDAKPLAVPLEKAARLRALTLPPLLAWPTFWMWAVALVGIVLSDVLTMHGVLALSVACVLNVLFMYPLFGVIHDATHRAISSNPRLNDWIGRIGLLMIAPHGTLGMFRWAHMQHHRHTNGAKDPDEWIHGRWWTLPLRWMSFDLGYLIFIPRKGDAIGKRQLRTTFAALAVLLAVIGVLVWMGYGMEVLLLWLIPSRVTMMLFGCVFFWLPHVKHDVSSEQNLTLATSMRLGGERWLGPLLQFHNYHLLHHLYPSAPPYNHSRIWALIEPELRQRDLAVQYGLAIHPVVVPGTRRSPA